MSYKPYKSVAEMKAELKEWQPSWGNYIATRGIIYACERLDEIAQLLQKRPSRRRKPSLYNSFFSKGMKAGKSVRQISDEWRSAKK